MSIQNHVATIRIRRRLSVAKLADLCGVTRQTIYSIESGAFVPNTLVGLKIARALDVSVEQLFELEQEQACVETDSIGSVDRGQPVRLCKVNGRMIALPVPAFPTFLPSMDGIAEAAKRNKTSVRALIDVAGLENRLVLAGCDPALSLLTSAVAGAGIEIITATASSRTALNWLKAGRVHVAGSHLLNEARGEYNLPFIRQLFPGGSICIVTFAHWEEGLVVKNRNPLSIRAIADLEGKRVRLINREKGAGSRDLLDKELKKAGVAQKSVLGYGNLASGHLSAAYSVACGTADCCVATRSAARRFGLHFIPLQVERFDLAFPSHTIELPATRALLDMLTRGTFRKRLAETAAYDATHTGDRLL